MGELDLCRTCPVRDRALCCSLADDELCGLKSIVRHRHVSRNQIVCWAGEEGVICANVVRGIFKISACATDGREQIVGLLYAGDFIGSPTPSTNRFTVTSLTDSTICVIPRPLLETFMRGHAEMERLLLDRTRASLDDARYRILLLARRSANARIADFLLDMAARSSRACCRTSGGQDLTFELELSRGQVAEILGLTNETVSRGLSRFRQEGLIDLPGGRAIAILNRNALAAIAEAS